ncbi:conserved hypothetical protein [uncultured Pleomorphomonas sp.]|uniref:Head decoration protein n=1 Tax=uncultured Pleomorphomonas sp. TaxID=442121 RepID=A0A212L776_9HYPH|nr:head decoration protein [uncultured Pleomorphomonas sp.]SCM73388.1 conserved hypothetical protein [uncultured Pleomorphomonas sp.]
MTVLEQDLHTTGAYLISEANGWRSRGAGAIAPGDDDLKAGAVLGQRTKGALSAVAAAGVPAPAGATITAAPAVTSGVTKVGVHTFRCVAAGAAGIWQHEDPDGVYVGTATTGVAYTGQGMTLTITDTGTDPAVGEVFKVTVSQADGDGEFAPYDPDANDGTEAAAAILYEGRAATDAAVRRTLTLRDSEVTAGELVWKDGLTIDQKNAALADLAKLGIIAR